MPSLPTTKSEPVAAPDSTDYLKNMVVMMEKKIRNLEKRKGKLEDYKERQTRGEELNEEQLKAIANLSAVLCQIDLLQDLIKQFNTQSAEVQKQQKRRLKKEKFEQVEREKKRFTEVLMLQSVLNNLGDETIREQFSSGSEGSVKLETTELDNLDEVYKLLNPERSTTESVVEQMKCAADHLQAVIDGREKAVSGTTYRELNDLISKIQSCRFFTEVKPADQEPEVDDGATEKEYVVVQSDEVPAPDSQEVQAVLPPEVPAEPEIPVTTHEESYQSTSEMHQSLPQQAPTKSFEQIVGNVQGRFNFIQDSEIDMDSPSHVDPAVLSVHQMPTHYQNPPPQMTQPPPENSMYTPQTHSDSQYPQYNIHTQQSNNTTTFPHNSTPPAASDNSDMGMMNTVSATNKPTSETYTNSMFSQPNAEPQHGSASEEVQEHMSSHQSDDYHRGGNMRQGGFRGRSRGGGGPGGNYSNGYNSRGGGGFRSGGDRGGYKGDKPSGNGFGDQRRGRGGGPRGGGYRGGPPTRGGRGGSGTGGRYRGQSQQSHSQQ